jgi:phosphoserine phosphatase RsbU/P
MSSKPAYLNYLNIIGKGLDRADWFLGTGAFVAILILLLLAPTMINRFRAPLQHRLTDTELVNSAEAWLQRHPLPHTGYIRGLAIHSRTEEYNALIRHFGVQGVDDACRNQPEIMIPLIHAQVTLTPDDAGHHSFASLLSEIRDGFRDGFAADSTNEVIQQSVSLVDLRYEFYLSPQGEVSRFERQGRQRYALTDVHYDAHNAGFGSSWTEIDLPEVHQIRFADTILPGELAHTDPANRNLDGTGAPRQGEQTSSSPGIGNHLPAIASDHTVLTEAGDSIRYIVGGPQLRRILDYHLKYTRWSTDYFNIESIAIRQQQELQIARIRLVSHEQILSRITTLEVEIDHIGHLHLIEPSYSVIDRTTAPGVNARLNVTMASIVVLTIIVLILMFRRTVRRMIDTRLSRPEALAAGMLAAVYFVTGYFSRNIELGYWSVGLSDTAGLLFGALLMAFGGWIFILVLSSYGSSVSQEVWPTRLRELNLLRRGYWINQPIGQALFRSVLIASILSALTIVLMLILPIRGLELPEGAVFLTHRTFVGSLNQLGVFLISTMIFTFIVLLGLAALAWKRTRSKWITIIVIVIFWTLLNTAAINTVPTHFDLLLNVVGGVLIGLIFWRYGLATTFFTILMHRIIMTVAWGLAIAGNPDFWQLMLLLMLPVAGLVAGVAGLATGRTMLQLPEVIPGYLIEMANRERMERELEISRHVQQRFLPLSTPQVEGYEMLAVCHPAAEVGGDYYEFLPADDGRLALAIGDVSGKGFKAAFYMTLIKGFTQSLAEQERDPARFLTRLNTLFYRNAERGTFVSMIFGYLDLKRRELSFARAGHNPAVWYRASTGKSELVKAGGMALGLVNDERFEASLQVQQARLQPGDIIVLYTDGYTEAMNHAGDLYGEGRFRRTIECYAGLSLHELVEALDEDILQFTEGHQQSDDMTILAIKVNEN